MGPELQTIFCKMRMRLQLMLIRRNCSLLTEIHPLPLRQSIKTDDFNYSRQVVRLFPRLHFLIWSLMIVRAQHSRTMLHPSPSQIRSDQLYCSAIIVEAPELKSQAGLMEAWKGSQNKWSRNGDSGGSVECTVATSLHQVSQGKQGSSARESPSPRQVLLLLAVLSGLFVYHYHYWSSAWLT